MKQFDMEQMVLLGMFDEGQRIDTISAMKDAYGDMSRDADQQDAEMLRLILSTIEDLEQITDEEYLAIDLSEYGYYDEDLDEDAYGYYIDADADSSESEEDTDDNSDTDNTDQADTNETAGS